MTRHPHIGPTAVLAAAFFARVGVARAQGEIPAPAPEARPPAGGGVPAPAPEVTAPAATGVPAPAPAPEALLPLPPPPPPPPPSAEPASEPEGLPAPAGSMSARFERRGFSFGLALGAAIVSHSASVDPGGHFAFRMGGSVAGVVNIYGTYHLGFAQDARSQWLQSTLIAIGLQYFSDRFVVRGEFGYGSYAGPEVPASAPGLMSTSMTASGGSAIGFEVGAGYEILRFGNAALTVELGMMVLLSSLLDVNVFTLGIAPQWY